MQPVAFVTFVEREDAEECKNDLQVSAAEVGGPQYSPVCI